MAISQVIEVQPGMESRNFVQVVAHALHLWNTPTDDASPFAHLSLYQALQRANPHEHPHRLLVRILEAGLHELEQHNADAVSLLRQRFLDERMRKDVARTLVVSISHLDRLQHEAIRQLADVILGLDAQARLELAQRRGKRSQRLRYRLGAMAVHDRAQEDSDDDWQLRYRLDQLAAYDRLFGVDELLDRLSAQLIQAGAPHVIAVEGLGGIGKTSLVIECLRRIVDHADFVRFAFVTAQQQQLLASGDPRFIHDSPQTPDAIVAAIAEQLLSAEELPSPAATPRLIQRMQQVLREERGLVVVDNLETIQALDSLLPTLHALANPAKVLVTTRLAPPTVQPVYRLIMPELSQTAALALLRHHVATTNVTQLLATPDDELVGIIELTGGNPLALRLVVGQCHAHPLALVLDDLRQARGAAVDHLYTFIYRWAWDHLGSAARRLLVAMLLIPPHGADFTLVNAVAGMNTDLVRDSLTELVRANLVYYHPRSVASGVYSLHGLTRTFLHKQVLRWM